MQTHGTDRRENCRELSWKEGMSMLTKYVPHFNDWNGRYFGMRL